MGCSPSILSSLSNNNNNRKDSGLYCSNNSDTNSNKIDAHNETNTALANQILVQSSNKDALEKVCWWNFVVFYVYYAVWIFVHMNALSPCRFQTFFIEIPLLFRYMKKIGKKIFFWLTHVEYFYIYLDNFYISLKNCSGLVLNVLLILWLQKNFLHPF